MNEYKKKFEELQDRDTFRGQQWFGERQRLVEEYAWAVPTKRAIEYIAEFGNIIEVGAGNGYWASLIDGAGGTVEATDIDPPSETYHHIRELSADDVRSRYMDEIERSVLLVWPPHGEGVAKTIVNGSPNNLLYVGEPRGGCTGDEAFFDALDERYTLITKIGIPSYEGINDNLYHYARKL